MKKAVQPKFRDQSYAHDMSHLFLYRKKGWSQVGSGCFAVVSEHKNLTDKVLKLTKLSDNMQCVFRTFVENKHPCFPVIHKYKEFRNNRGELFAAMVMERLDPITDWESKIYGVNRIAKDYAYGKEVPSLLLEMQNLRECYKNGRVMCSCGDPSCYVDLDEDECDEEARLEQFCYANLYNLKYRPKLIEAVDIMRTAFEKADLWCSWDLHNANIMRRGQVPVITDPVT